MIPDERHALRVNHKSQTGYLDETLSQAVRTILANGCNCSSFNRRANGADPGIAIVILVREIFELIGPSLLEIAIGEMCGLGQKTGILRTSGTMTVGQLFEWLDEQPPRCAYGQLAITIDDRKTAAFLIGFTGPICARVVAELETIGVKLNGGTE